MISSLTITFSNLVDYAYFRRRFKIFSSRRIIIIIQISLVVMKKWRLFIIFAIWHDICVIIWNIVQNVKFIKHVDINYINNCNLFSFCLYRFISLSSISCWLCRCRRRRIRSIVLYQSIANFSNEYYWCSKKILTLSLNENMFF